MFTLERQKKIEELIKSKGSLRVTELSEMLMVSEATVRRDLQEMEDRGLLIRTHGGAMDTTSTSFEPSFKEKEDERRDDKALIGIAAAKMVENGDTIVLDSGTTTLEIAKRINAKNITVITNSIDIATELSNKENIELIVTGGSLRFLTRAMVGHIAENVVNNFRVDKSFIGTNGISLKEGITTPNHIEAQIKKAMISVAKKVIVVADTTKFNKVSFSLVCPLRNISTIVTAGKIESNILKVYKDHGIEIIIG